MLETVAVTECKIRSAELITHCGHLSHRSIIKTQVLDLIDELTPDQCRDAGHTGYVKIMPSITIKIQINATTRESILLKGKISASGGCTGESHKIDNQIIGNVVVNKEYEITIIKYSANFDAKSGVMLTNGYSMCRINEPYCKTGFSVLVYNHIAPVCNLYILERISVSRITR